MNKTLSRKNNNSGSEFPEVTEQTSLISEALGRAPSGSFRSIISALASTFIGDGLSTSIISPTDSSATPLSNYHSTCESANLSSEKINFLHVLLSILAMTLILSFRAKTRNLYKSFYGSRIKYGMTVVAAMTLFVILVCPGSVFAINTGQFTASVWVKPTSSIASQALLGKAEELRIFTDASGFVGCQIKATTWQTAATATTNALALNTWAHVACTYDKSNIKVYVNGTQVATQAETDAPDDTAAAFEIGEDDSASTTYTNLTGTVDNFQFYNYARTQKQIVSDMTGGDPSSQGSSGRIAGAIAHYRFDEGQGTTANNSGNGGSALNGTLTGMSSPATSTSGWTQSGKFDKALIFDGSNDYVSVADNSALDLTDAITISAWIKPTTVTGECDGVGCEVIVAKRPEGTVGNYSLEIGDNTAQGAGYLGFRFTNGSLIDTTTQLSVDNWYHVTATYDRTQIRLFVNGRLVKSDNETDAMTTNDNPLNIGGYNNSTGTFTGSIDEVKIYNYALTSDEIKTDYNKGSSLILGAAGNNTTYQSGAANQQYCVPGDATSCVAPVGEWNFEEGKGGSVNDSSGNNNVGTWNGTGTKHWTPGKQGWGGNFNGSDDYVEASVTSAFGTGDYTLELWYKKDSSTLLRVFAQNSNVNYGAMIFPFITVSSSNIITIQRNANGQYSFANTDDNKWHHLVFTRQSGTVYAYLDGIQKTLTASGTLYDQNGYNFTGNTFYLQKFWYGGSNYYYKGSIDQVKIFNYARSAAQIAWDYNRGAPVGHWKFDECQGSVANDSSGNSNNGTITIGGSGEDTLGTCTTSSTAWGSGATGKYNSSLSFDGIDDYVSVGTLTGRYTNNVTVSAWAKHSPNVSSWDDILSGSCGDLLLTFNSDGTVQWGGQCNSPFGNVTYAVSNSTWHLLTGTYDGTTSKLYVDGVLVTSSARSGSFTPSALYIGSAGTSEYYGGQIDDVRIYNYALTATQVKTLYNNGAVFYGPSTGAP